MNFGQPKSNLYRNYWSKYKALNKMKKEWSKNKHLERNNLNTIVLCFLCWFLCKKKSENQKMTGRSLMKYKRKEEERREKINEVELLLAVANSLEVCENMVEDRAFDDCIIAWHTVIQTWLYKHDIPASWMYVYMRIACTHSHFFCFCFFKRCACMMIGILRKCANYKVI